MRCGLYASDGTLLSEGSYGLRRDGAIEMVVEDSAHVVSQGDGPLIFAEGPRRFAVRVEAVHGARDPSLVGPVEMYHLVPLD